VDLLRTYAEVTDPVIDYYRARPRFGTIDGLQHVDQVTAAPSSSNAPPSARPHSQTT
jgi:adenylate kinase family enzyme